MRRQRRVTSKDVAKRAGVSAATVSAVLNNARGNVRVSSATRDRIQRIASELGYSPNRAAQALRRRQSGVICFVPMAVKAERHPFDIPVQTLLGSYVSRAALSHEFHVIEVPAEIAAGSADDLSGFVSNLHADGVIFHGAKTEEHVQAILDLGIPAVQLMRPHAVSGSHTSISGARSSRSRLTISWSLATATSPLLALSTIIPTTPSGTGSSCTLWKGGTSRSRPPSWYNRDATPLQMVLQPPRHSLH